MSPTTASSEFIGPRPSAYSLSRRPSPSASTTTAVKAGDELKHAVNRRHGVDRRCGASSVVAAGGANWAGGSSSKQDKATSAVLVT